MVASHPKGAWDTKPPYSLRPSHPEHLTEEVAACGSRAEPEAEFVERRSVEIAYVRTGDGWEVNFLAHSPAAGHERPRAARRLSVLDRDACVLLGASTASVQPADEWMLEPASDC